MRINRPSTETLSQKEIKFLCDVCLYNLSDEDKFYSRLAESFSLLEIKNKNIVELYSMHLEAKQLDVEKFLTSYKSVRMLYMIEGEERVWRQVDYIRNYVKNRNRKVFNGDLLEVKSEEMWNEVCRYLRISAWKENMNTTFMPDCIAYINTIPVGSGEYIDDILTSDIKSNPEGEEFTTLLEDNSETMEKSTVETLLYSSEFYVQTMKDIEAATATLFKDDSNDRSSLDMYYSSLINYLALKSLQRDISYLKSKYDGFSVSLNYKAPYKIRKTSGSFGYRCYISQDYRKQRLGNESKANEVFQRGIRAIRALEDIVYRYRNKSNQELFLQGYNDFSEQNILPCGIIAYDGLLKGLFSAYAVEDLLKAIDLPLWAFPSIELRDKTWKRFSNFFELLNYYRVYEKLNTPMQPTDRRLSLLNSNITNMHSEFNKSTENSTLDEILNNIRRIGLESVIKLKYNRGARESVPSYIREESKLYSQSIETLTSLTQDQDYIDFTHDKMFRINTEYLLSVYNLLFELEEDGVSNFITEDITFKRMYKKNINVNEVKRKARISKVIGEKSSLPASLTTGVLVNILSNLENLDTLFRELEKNFTEIFQYMQESFYNYKLLNGAYDNNYTWTLFLNTFNSVLLYVLLELKEDILVIIRDHAGLDSDNKYEKEGVRLLDCVVDMYKNPKLRAIVDSKDLTEFVRKYFILTLGEKYGISLNQIQAIRAIDENDWCYANTLFENIKSSLTSMLSYVLDKNMSFDKAKSVKTSVFNLDSEYKTASDIINNHIMLFKGLDGRTEEMDGEEYQNYLDIIKYMKLNDSCLVGRDNVPIRQYLGMKKHESYYVYSIYGYKLLLPDGKEPVRMNIDDFKYVLSGGVENGKLQ